MRSPLSLQLLKGTHFSVSSHCWCWPQWPSWDSRSEVALTVLQSAMLSLSTQVFADWHLQVQCWGVCMLLQLSVSGIPQACTSKGTSFVPVLWFQRRLSFIFCFKSKCCSIFCDKPSDFLKKIKSGYQSAYNASMCFCFIWEKWKIITIASKSILGRSLSTQSQIIPHFP